MKQFVSLLLVLIAISTIYNLYINKDLASVVSTVDNKEYSVRKLPDKQEAANKLANISKLLNKLVKHVSSDKREGVKQLVTKFNSDNIIENVPDGQYKAYSVNKGEQLALCIRKVTDNTFIDINTIIFVSIHELAHIMTDEIGHTPKFWSNMKYLLEKGIEIDIYKAIDYSKSPTDYCGQEIDSTPLDL